MKHNTPRRSNLFLMELIIAILFFSLSGAVCMQLFLKADKLSSGTSAQNHALMLARSTASSYESGCLSGDLGGDSQLIYYYDSDWRETTPGDAVFRMIITSSPDPEYQGLFRGTITVSGDQELCCLNVSFYQPHRIEQE